ncbi:MAG: hypothetical protein ACON44_06280 [Candidatus Puniceispirillaceae bacterium]
MSHSYFRSADFILGVAILAFALVTLFVWIPFDIDTGLVEKVRRRNVIGDSLGPSVAVILIAASAIALMRSSKNSPAMANHKTWFRIFGFYVVLFAIALVVMRFTGPLFVSLFNEFVATELTYRNLRNIWPLKYVGYVSGGTLLLCALSHFMDQSLSRKRAVLFLAISCAIALFFDLPFEDILLPPNGDV